MELYMRRGRDMEAKYAVFSLMFIEFMVTHKEWDFKDDLLIFYRMNF